MNILIIEDEIVAQQALARMLVNTFPDVEICDILDSVHDTIDYLENAKSYPDIIFMDVELSDGNCFDIFERTEIHCPVIMVTAYDNYAVKAFEVNSVDYLLKPVDVDDLRRAIERCRKRQQSGGGSISRS